LLLFLFILIGFLLLAYGLELVGIKLMGLVEAGLLSTTLFALVATGECINEKAGCMNIGLEGILLLSSILGVYGAELFSNGAFGLLFGLIIGASLGFLFGLTSIYLKADQIIIGLCLNLFALGFVPFLLMALWAFPGIHVFPRELMVPRFSTPIGYLSPLTPIAIIIAILAHLFLHRTLLGLKIRITGEKPEAVDVAGIKVDRIRLFASTLGGALTGLAGAFLPLCWFGTLVKEISAGRGFIALACVIFGGLEPLLSLGAALIFGFTEGLAYSMSITPGIKEIVPIYFMNMAPYLATLIITVSVVGRRRFPSAIGKPYIRE
jgi:simple sugar transport system permease protein